MARDVGVSGIAIRGRLDRLVVGTGHLHREPDDAGRPQQRQPPALEDRAVPHRDHCRWMIADRR